MYGRTPVVITAFKDFLLKQKKIPSPIQESSLRSLLLIPKENVVIKKPHTFANLKKQTQTKNTTTSIKQAFSIF